MMENLMETKHTKKTSRFWDRLAGGYDRQNESGDVEDADLVRRIRPHLHPCDIALDYGCATGTWTLALANSVTEIHGLDISAKMIDLARAKAEARQVDNARFAQGTIFDDGLAAGSFDAILALNILHLLDDLPRVAGRIHHLLKPGGRFISVTPCLGEVPAPLRFILRAADVSGLVPHINFPRRSDLDRLVAGAGLQTVEANVIPGKVTDYFLVAGKA
jgi:ubiquinone/menaquinone biosynthesis C-methylase UbiE